MESRRWIVPLLCAAALAAGEAAPAREPQACRLDGVAHEALCGSVQRALDPARPDGPRIDVHFAVLPALARNKLPDPVFFIAGGPGQSAIELAGPLAAQFARLGNRRDLVFVDQRGTGRSAPLRCDDGHDAARALAERFDEATQLARLAQCRARLMQLPHGDLRFYGTTLAMADLDAVRAALGAPQVNLLAVSYGTRAAVEYLRLYPSRARRLVLDGMAPADMVLPEAFAADNQAALDALFVWCAADALCSVRHPRLRTQWQALHDGLPREVTLTHPLTGVDERLTLTRAMLASMVRPALYMPALAGALPQAIADAAAGRFAPLVGLASALGGSSGRLYAGMHFSVVCSEDLPRRGARSGAADGATLGAAASVRMYEQACAGWPRAAVDAAFYTTPRAPVAVWLLSGGDDPATPPRHGARIAQALGPKARHTVVPHGGHGVMALPCLRDAVQRFVDAVDDDAALSVEAGCAAAAPRARLFVPPSAAAAASGAAR